MAVVNTGIIPAWVVVIVYMIGLRRLGTWTGKALRALVEMTSGTKYSYRQALL